MQLQRNPESGKICPFSLSHPEGPVACTPHCNLYRQGKGDYECFIKELQAISWSTKKPGAFAPNPQPRY